MNFRHNLEVFRLSTRKTWLALGLNEFSYGPILMSLGGHPHLVTKSPDTSHFREVNIMGIDFMNAFNITLWWDFPKRRGKLYIGEEWEVGERAGDK